jgi:trehalose-6-phosphate synthase
VPSREDVPAYRALRLRVESEVARINARFGTPAWTPIRYVYGSVDAVELAALYRAADVMLVTPLRDGMNLVAKEFVASRVDRDGVLVLSERAGAAAELREALLVDPTDVDGLARAYAAALGMSPAERHVRMRRLRARVAEHDVARWAARCVEHLATASTAARPR